MGCERGRRDRGGLVIKARGPAAHKEREGEAEREREKQRLGLELPRAFPAVHRTWLDPRHPRCKMLPPLPVALLALFCASWSPLAQGAPRTVTPRVPQKKPATRTTPTTAVPRAVLTSPAPSRAQQGRGTASPRPSWSPASLKTTAAPTWSAKRATLPTEKPTGKTGTREHHRRGGAGGGQGPGVSSPEDLGRQCQPLALLLPGDVHA